MMEDTRKREFRKGQVFTISAVHLIHDIYTSFLAPALPKIIDKLGISYGLAGSLAVIQRIPSLLNPLMGIIAERPVAKFMVISSPAITAASMSLIGIAPGYIFLSILLVISGFSSMMWHIPTPVMIRQFAGERTGKGMSYYMAGGELARTLGPLVILGVIELWGLEGTWKMMPLGFIASLVLWFKLRKVNFSPSEHKKESGNYRAIFRKFYPAFILTGGFTFFQAGMKASMTYYLPTFLTDHHGLSLVFADSALTVLQLAGAAGALFSGTISDRIGRSSTLKIISIVAPLIMLLFLQVNVIWMIPVLIPMGFFLFAPTAVMLALIQELDTDKKAFVNALYMFINFFISALMIPLVGILIDKYGFMTSYYVFAFAALGAIFIVHFTRNNLKSITS